MVRGRCESKVTALAVLVLAFTLIAISPAGADFDAGQRAWDAGNVDDALSEWRSAANGGDRRAMLAIGRLHLQGLGVVQDYVEAHKWLNLAASRGEAEALGERNALAAKMTPAQLANAQERAAAWRPGSPSVGDAPDTPAAPADTGTPAPAMSSEARRPPPEAIRETQALLAALGYQPGPADGVWGRRTGAAYSAFLRDAGLPQAEILIPQALRALRAIAERRGVGQAGRGATGASAASAPARQQTSAPRPASIRPDALHRAAQVGDIEVLKAALAAGVDVDARDGQGWTALMHAVNKGYPLLVGPLLAAGAGVDVRAPDGATALFMAAAHGHTEVVVMLMKAGADISIRGPKGKTAVDVARARYGEPEAAREKGENAVVVALVDGRKWADVERERLAREQAEEAEARERERRYREQAERDRVLMEAGQTAEKRSGLRFKDCVGCPELIVVPAGKFRMGSPKSEEARYDYEGPRHRVTIGQSFAVGVYEVTRGQWSAFVSESGHSAGDSCWIYEGGEWEERPGRSWRNPGYSQSDTHPAVCVSWGDAQTYVRWLSGKTGKRYRLLSEAEWEYVARAGTRTARYWGESERGQCRYANGADESAERRYSDWNVISCDDAYVETAPVGSFAANEFGLHDMLGNVWEWTQDCWNDSYKGAPADGGAWESGDCGRRVLRGGSWNVGPRDLRSADRGGIDSAGRGYNVGFRVARTLD